MNIEHIKRLTKLKSKQIELLLRVNKGLNDSNMYLDNFFRSLDKKQKKELSMLNN